MKQNKILIIGTVPPPTGGVTIHVKRLLDLLNQVDIPYTFFDYKRQGIFDFLKSIFAHKIIHNHVCNTTFNLIFAFFAFIFRKKLIITRHGDVCNKSILSALMIKITLRLATVPILLNQKSYAMGRKINHKAILMSAFIPPQELAPLPDFLIKELKDIRKKYKKIFCTNAFNLVFDANGYEIYGISELLNVFCQLPEYFLIVAACNQKYASFFEQQHVMIPPNVLLITTTVDYMSLLQEVDASIRNTTTDGDALSVRESLYLQRCVFATDCVSRPEGTILYHDAAELLEKLKRFTSYIPISNVENTGSQLIDLYRNLCAEAGDGH